MFENLRRTQSAGQRAYYETPPGTPEEKYKQNPHNNRHSRDLTSHSSSTNNRRTTSDRAPSPPPSQTQTSQQSLTHILLSSTPTQFESATQHPFLRHAGQGTLPKQTLSLWLSQDRLYAEAHITFLTSLIARITLPYAFVSDKPHSLRWRILNLLTGCLSNIQKEIRFFEEVAGKYGLDLDLPPPDSDRSDDEFGPNAITEQWITLFRSFHLDPSQPLLEGLLILWATEKCYLEAWRYASSFLSDSKGGDNGGKDDADGGALREKFIPNWSSNEFEGFVDDIAKVTDELAGREGAIRKIEVFKATWLHVLEIEKGFWPDVGE